MTVALLVTAALPLGLAAGRLARSAADGDRRRRLGVGPTRGWRIEVVTAIVWMVTVARTGPDPAAVPLVVVVTALVAVTITDLRDRRIPDRILYPTLAATALTMAPVALALDEPARLLRAAGGAALFGSVLGVVHLITPRGLGRGDAKLAVLLGAALGWSAASWPETGLLVASTLAAASALGLGLAALLPGGPAGRGVAVPFAPALAVATVAVVLAPVTFR